MNELQIFENEEFKRIRTIIIDDELWFVGRDLASNLGYSRFDNMLRIVDSEDKRNIDPQSVEFSGLLDNGGGPLEPNKNIRILSLVNESGMYNAIFSSEKEEAKNFKRWVTKEILPSVRKYGGN